MDSKTDLSRVKRGEVPSSFVSLSYTPTSEATIKLPTSRIPLPSCRFQPGGPNHGPWLGVTMPPKDKPREENAKLARHANHSQLPGSPGKTRFASFFLFLGYGAHRIGSVKWCK